MKRRFGSKNFANMDVSTEILKEQGVCLSRRDGRKIKEVKYTLHAHTLLAKDVLMNTQIDC